MKTRYWSAFLTLMLTVTAGAGLFAVARVNFQNQLPKETHFRHVPLSQFPSSYLSILTLGHRHLYDDFAHLWLLQVLMDREAKSRPEEVLQIIRQTLKHKPPIETAYMLSCFVAMQELGKPEYCQEMILTGLEALPLSWRLPMTQGFVHAFVLNQPLEAANFYLMAASRPKSPAYVARVAQKLAKKEGVTDEDMERSLQIMMGTEHNQRFREFLQRYRQEAPGEERPNYGRANP